MFLDELIVRGDNDPRTMSLNQFLTAPAEILESADDRIWFGSVETFAQIPQARKSLPSEPGIVQFHSDPLLQELSEVASPSVKAGLGISGLTSVSKSIVDAAVPVGDDALSQTERALSIEFCLSLAGRCESWKSVSQPATSFRYFSPIPARPASSDRKLLDTIRSLSDDRLTNGNSAKTAAMEIRAGLLLIHDFLEPSHQCSQSIEGAGPDVNGDYWHGLMHRREPDFGNSKYWFRRVGSHPCFARLAAAARDLAEHFHDRQVTEWIGKLTRSGWDSMACVDFFQEAHQPDDQQTACHDFASCLQMQEMLILLAYCCR